MIARIWFEVRGKNSTNNILVEIQVEGQVDLLGDAWTAKTRVTLLYFHDGFDNFVGGSLGTGLPPASSWRI